jgi:hypothetical protein
MDNDNPLIDRIRGWFEHSPKAQQVYHRLSADLDAIVARVESATSGLRERVGPIIDPARPEPAPEPIPDPASEPGLTRDEQAAMEANQPDTPKADEPAMPKAEGTMPGPGSGAPAQEA